MNPIVVTSLRGRTAESQHLVDAVIMDYSGKVVRQFGEIHRPTFARSAVKLLQALALVESGAAEKFQISNEWLSLACGSHRGEDFHIGAARAWLDRMNLSPDSLACGAHDPADEKTKIGLYRSGGLATKVHNNCSGKHCGMLATAVHLGEKTEGYEKYDHPVQVRVRKILSEASGLDFNLAPWGVDGCSLPTYAMPLSGLAKAMTIFLPEASVFADRKSAADKIKSAIIQAPLMISGSQGLCSQIVRVSNGSVIAKIGAEGVYTAIIPEQGLAVALKVRDGAIRAAKTALLHLLVNDLKVLKLEQVELLTPYSERLIHNWAGLLVGQMHVS